MFENVFFLNCNPIPFELLISWRYKILLRYWNQLAEDIKFYYVVEIELECISRYELEELFSVI